MLPKEAGNKRSIQIALTKCTFSGGQSLDLNASDIVVIVGPNNSGKSAALNNIIELVRHLKNKTEVITHLTFSKQGSEAEFNKWISEHCFKEDLRVNHFGETASAYSIDEERMKGDWVV